MPLLIYSYNPGSEGAKNLKEALGIQRIKNERSKFVGGPGKTVINWGSTEVPLEVRKCRIINIPTAVQGVANKLTFFQRISRHERGILPPWTTDQKEAVAWAAGGHTVCARTILNGHSARGLVLMEKDNPRGFVKAPLYTRYVKKQEEYRVHVAMGEVIDVQRKTLNKERAEEIKNAGQEINWKVRNLENGFIYQRNNVHPGANVLDVALKAVRYSELDFGAVDIVVDSGTKQAFVLEINSAPGLEGTTVENYANVFRRLR